MIQRIQSLYLFLVVILGVLVCIYPPVQFLTPDATSYLGLTALQKWPLAVISIAISLLALITVFLFKHRLLQARLCVVNAVLCLGDYALWALYIAYVMSGHESVAGILLPEGSQWYPSVWAAMPLVCLVLCLMALRRILKDEALVRAADRLR